MTPFQRWRLAIFLAGLSLGLPSESTFGAEEIRCCAGRGEPFMVLVPDDFEKFTVEYRAEIKRVREVTNRIEAEFNAMAARIAARQASIAVQQAELAARIEALQ